MNLYEIVGLIAPIYMINVSRKRKRSSISIVPFTKYHEIYYILLVYLLRLWEGKGFFNLKLKIENIPKC